MNNWTKLTLLTSLLSLNAYAIRGGTPLDANTLPSVGALEPACTATLITPDTIITAAHCVRQAATNEYLKFHYIDSSGNPRVLSAMPNLNPKVMATLPSQELALIRLNGVANVSSFPKLGLDAMSTRQKPGNIVGFGATESAPFSPVKLGGSVSYSKSLVTISTFTNIPMFKSKPANSSSNNIACQGDSGGPLLNNGKLVGVASGYYEADDAFLAQGMSGQCQSTPWVYYVPISPYIAWIKASLTELGSASLPQ